MVREPDHNRELTSFSKHLSPWRFNQQQEQKPRQSRIKGEIAENLLAILPGNKQKFHMQIESLGLKACPQAIQLS